MKSDRAMPGRLWASRYMEQYLNGFDLHTKYYIFVCRKDKEYHTWQQI